MKVSIEHTLQVSDEQRQQIAAYIDGDGGKKRDATRAEMKEFIWMHGASWDVILRDESAGEAAEPEVEADPEQETLDGMDLI
jgi:hypothetical protein